MTSCATGAGARHVVDHQGVAQVWDALRAGAGHRDDALTEVRIRKLRGVYVWVDGIHFNIRLEDDRLCTLVMIGVKADGTKELVAVEDGYRESTESWASLLRNLRDRGLRAPAVAVGDGALGFWSALRDVWPETTPQRDWRYKLANVLDKLPKRLRPRVKRALHEIMYAPTRRTAAEARRVMTTRGRGRWLAS